MTPFLNVGLIGCGQIARQAHLPALQRAPGVRIAALADSDPVRLEAVHRRCPSAAAYENYARVLDAPDIDAVVICLPTSLHASASVTAFERGKHVYCEKPLATSLDEAAGVVRAWRKAGRVGMIGFNYRFNELNQRLRLLLRAGRVGKVLEIRTTFCTTSDVVTAWRARRGTGGGVLLDLAGHHVDLVRFLLSQEVLRVTAAVRTVQNEDDTAVLDMEFSDGSASQSFFTYGSIEEDCVEVFGEEGKLSVDRYSSLEVRSTAVRRGLTDHLDGVLRVAHAVRRVGYAVRKRQASMHEPSYGLAMQHFVHAARTGEFDGPDMLEGYACAAVIEAAEESARERKTVSVRTLAAGVS